MPRETAQPECVASVGNFLRMLFQVLERRNIRYCVLHTYDELPERLPSDLDIAVVPQDASRLAFVVEELAAAGYRLVQCLRYAVGARYLVFSWLENQLRLAVAVDFIWEHRRRGVILSSGADLVESRRRQGDFWIPSPANEFTYLLGKKVIKGAIGPQQARKLEALAGRIGTDAARALAAGYFGHYWGDVLVAACRRGAIGELIDGRRRQLWRAALLRHPLNAAAWAFAESGRLLYRWRHPTGLFLAVFGPDGAGKSTLLENLPPLIESFFRRSRMFHWRPGLLGRRASAGPVTQPHGRPCRGAIASALRLSGWLLDYFCGYWLRVRPLLARSTLVLFDRYVHDLEADPRRYRYGGARWLARFAGRIAPSPDLVLVLDAPADVMRSRKQEIAPEELERQRRAYLDLARRLPNSVLIDAARPASEVAAETARAIADYLGRRLPALEALFPRIGGVEP